MNLYALSGIIHIIYVSYAGQLQMQLTNIVSTSDTIAYACLMSVKTKALITSEHKAKNSFLHYSIL